MHTLLRLPAALVLAVAAIEAPAAAQSRPGPAADVSAGWAGFVDDATIDHAVVGGSVRWYATPRISVGPEVVFMVGPDTDRDLFLVGTLFYDLLASGGDSGPRRASPYVVAGGGFYRHWSRLRGGTFATYQPTFTAGGGLRLSISDRVYVTPEFRVGWELYLRATAAIGVRLGE